MALRWTLWFAASWWVLLLLLELRQDFIKQLQWLFHFIWSTSARKIIFQWLICIINFYRTAARLLGGGGKFERDEVVDAFVRSGCCLRTLSIDEAKWRRKTFHPPWFTKLQNESGWATIISFPTKRFNLSRSEINLALGSAWQRLEIVLKFSLVIQPMNRASLSSTRCNVKGARWRCFYFKNIEVINPCQYFNSFAPNANYFLAPKTLPEKKFALHCSRTCWLINKKRMRL